MGLLDSGLDLDFDLDHGLDRMDIDTEVWAGSGTAPPAGADGTDGTGVRELDRIPLPEQAYVVKVEEAYSDPPALKTDWMATW